MRGERHWQNLLHSWAEVIQGGEPRVPGGKCYRARHSMVTLLTQKIWIEGGEWAGRCLCGVTPGCLGLSSTSRPGGLQRRLQRGTGRWSARITESSSMCHDVDALGKYKHFTAQRFSAPLRTQGQGHFIPFFLCLLNSNTYNYSLRNASNLQFNKLFWLSLWSKCNGLSTNQDLTHHQSGLNQLGERVTYMMWATEFFCLKSCCVQYCWNMGLVKPKDGH